MTDLRVEVRRRRRRRRLTIAAAALLLGPPLAFLALDLLFPFPFDALHRPPATWVEDRDGRPLRAFLAADETWRWPVRLEELPDELIEALVVSEDGRFGRHPGVDPLAVTRAAWSNLRARRVVSGASTIAMQVARMAEPKPRTFGAKLREAFRALQLTQHLERHERLEAWLNLAPFGGNVEGVGAAAWFWFGKRPDALSTGEIALLTALPRAPSRLDPSRDPHAARRARDAVLVRLEAAGAIDSARAVEARRQPLPSARRAAPLSAPHLTRRVAARYRGVPRLQTTLDRTAQSAAESALRARIDELRARGIGNGAIVILDNPTRAVRAYVGSAGFDERAFQGQVDGAAARRSPGSTLKPFLYAAMFEVGSLLPDTRLLDLPTDFSGYVVENFDGEYRGLVTAREALAHSLNAPAVRTLSEFGLEPFLTLLREGGLETLDRPAGEYGLPLVLGGGEVTLLDLTNLYATLAAGGAHRPVALRAEEERAVALDEPHRLFSTGAAALVSEILRDVERPDLPGSWQLARDVPAVAWKTGTSYGHRDAWAIGSSANFTIGVWVGNFNGAPAKGISGARDAGPLLFDLFRAVDRDGPLTPPAGRARAALHAIELCALSGRRPNPFCPRRVSVTVPDSTTRLPSCRWHERVFVDAQSGALLPGDCLDRRPHRATVLERYPADLVAWWRTQGGTFERPPVVGADCAGIVPPGAPAIVAPDPATPYVVRRDAPREYQRLTLIARPAPLAAPEAERLFWYQDGRLVASGRADEPLSVPLEPGLHRLVVVDGAGRSDGVTYRVE